MSSVKGTPAYWKQFLYDVLVIGKQLRIPMYFLILPCTDLRWEESPNLINIYIINKLNNLELIEEQLEKLSYQESCNLLNNSPVLVARYFQ